jgi:hypothetical protein
MKSKKIIAKILFFISTLIAVPCFGQLKYSIDIEPAKNRQIDLSYRMTTIKETIKTNHQIRVKHRVIVVNRVKPGNIHAEFKQKKSGNI